MKVGRVGVRGGSCRGKRGVNGSRVKEESGNMSK